MREKNFLIHEYKNMKKGSGRYFLQIICTVAVLIFQLGSVHYNWYFTDRIESLEFGSRTTVLAGIAIALGIFSGFLASFIYFLKQKPAANDQDIGKNIGIILIFVLAVVVLVIKILYSAYGPRILPFSLIRPIIRDLYEWVMHSQVPAFLVGFTIGWIRK